LTPVIISNSVEWLSFDDWQNERNALNKKIEEWRKDWESKDVNRYLKHYSNKFKTSDQNLEQYAQQKRQVNIGKEWIKVKLSNMSMFRDPGKEELVVVTFEQDYQSNNLSNQMKKLQYWIREDGTWKIVFEGTA
jgi:murein L,D-transpeptidase YafK